MINLRKVYLDNIPKKGKNYDWKHSVGCIVPFVYEDVKGEIEIVEYLKSGKLVIKLGNKVFDEKPMARSVLTSCAIGYYLNKYTVEFKLQIGQNIKEIKRDITITNRRYIDKKGKRLKYYEYHCHICNTESEIEESSLLRGVGCSVCSGKKVVQGVNDIATTDRWMVDLGVSEDDSKKYTKSSGKSVIVKCPDCGLEKSIVLRNMYNYKSICCVCKDGIRYPEKFMISVLEQAGVDFTRQFSVDGQQTRYDFYIPKYSLIIETHGMQHYKDTFCYVGGRTLEEEQENDLYKKLLAKMWGYNYIAVDCRYSDLDWIKNNILKSNMIKFINLESVVWNKCSEFAMSNMSKIVCDYWNTREDNETAKTIAKKFNVSDVTISTYLKNGTKVGWCNYDTQEEKRKSSSRSGKKSGKKVAVYKLNGEYVGTFKSSTELERISVDVIGVKLYQGCIASVISGKVKQHKGYTFKYV